MLEMEELFAGTNEALEVQPLVAPGKVSCMPLRSVLRGKDFVAANTFPDDLHGQAGPGGANQERLGEEFQKAYEKGMQEAQAAIGAMQERYQDAIADLAFLRDQIIQESEEALLRLAYSTAKELVMGDVEARQGFTEKMVEHALGLLRESDKITMRIAPDDVVWLKEKRPDLFGEKSIVHVQEDPSLVLGGVVAECNLGRVDASMERRLADLAANLLVETPTEKNEDVEGEL
ncbi:MAG: FliH/SctL family protein [Myxococcota bacterium]|jgi:flagellar biosynthesis/type III secretory pathway protein FliH|nr:FliH/SctL family protein [Myxococcota bacterium]